MGKKQQPVRVRSAPKKPGKAGRQEPDRPRASRWTGRILLLALVPAVLLAVLEGGLRIIGFGHSTALFEREASGEYYTMNPRFDWQFYLRRTGEKAHPFRMPVEKGKGVVRIFILGESAALGAPAPAFGFGRMLGVMLEQQHPERRFEIINVAMRGINSHIVRRIAIECSRHEPDLFLLLVGNNESVGLHAPGKGSTVLDRHLWLIRLVEKIKAARLGQWIGSMAVRESAHAQDQEFFREHRLAWNDPARERIYSFFERNLREICDAAARGGGKVLVCTVPVNVADCAPFGALHKPGLSTADRLRWQEQFVAGEAARQRAEHEEALAAYRSASQIDDARADLQFRLGQTLLALGKAKEAREHFLRARDWDALQVRADSRLNGIIRQASAEGGERGLRGLDLEERLSRSDGNTGGMPGKRFFYEHVHLRFDGNYRLAEAVASEVAAIFDLPPAPAVSAEGVKKMLAFTSWDELQTDRSMAEALSHAPFLDRLDNSAELSALQGSVQERARTYDGAAYVADLQVYREAIQSQPEDWEIRQNLGRLRFSMKQYAEAIEPFEFVVRRFPNMATFRQPLAAALARSGRVEEAKRQLREALRLDPEFEFARKSLDELEAARE